MAGSKSDYLELKLLDYVLGKQAFAQLDNVYIALYTVAPTDAGGGTEVTGGSYVRKTVVNNATNWPNASAGLKENGTEITFVTATADWGELVAFAIFDTATTGNMLIWGDLTVHKTILNGDTAKFAVGDIDWNED